ncbi:MAG: hypothetical protein JSS27_07020 [Planctomycetes bacterium]|nr:hypothetical protein [Planctomycetota bacterium]
MTATSTSGSERGYGISPALVATCLAIVGALLLMPLGLAVAAVMSENNSTLGAAIVVALVISPAVAFILWAALGSRMWIRPDGIKLRGTLGFSSQLVPWSSIERILWQPGKEGIVLREPMTDPASRHMRNWAGVRINGMQFYDAEQQALIAQQRYLILKGFAYWFRRGDALAQLRQFAPELAADVDAQMPAYLTTRTKNRRTLVGLFVVVAVLCALAGVAGVMKWELPPDVAAVANRTMLVGMRVAMAVIGLGMLVYVAVNCQAAWRFLRSGQYGYAIFWLAMAITQALFAILIASSFVID